MSLKEKILARSAIIGVIGLGYVGVPISIEFLKAGFYVRGFDMDTEKVSKLNRAESYMPHIDTSILRKRKSHFKATRDFSELQETDCIIICVPTPLNNHREPDMGYVRNTGCIISNNIKQGQLIILESTVYPGATEEELKPILEQSGLKAGEDFYLAYSPERIDPGNKKYPLSTVPKILGAYTESCLDIALVLYNSIFEKIYTVSNIKTAESSKLIENIYRAVNIALVNELKILFNMMEIDIWEVIEAAKTKPYGFTPFYPGPGMGGHCIPVDPFYLTWKAREFDFTTRFIELAGEINTTMPYYVLQRTLEAYNDRCLIFKGSRILILGVSYKPDIADLRESPALKLIELYESKGAMVDYNDPFVPLMPKTRRYNFQKNSVVLSGKSISSYDCVVIVTDHSIYDVNLIADNARLIIDTRNLLGRHGKRNSNTILA